MIRVLPFVTIGALLISAQVHAAEGGESANGIRERMADPIENPRGPLESIDELLRDAERLERGEDTVTPVPATEFESRYGPDRVEYELFREQTRETLDIETTDDLDDWQIDLQSIQLDLLYRALAEEQRAEEGRMELGIVDAVLLALDQNRDIELARIAPLQADGDIFSAWGEFDPIWANQVTYTEAEQTSSAQTLAFGGSQFASIRSYRTQFSSSISGRIPYGTQYSATLTMNEDEDTFNRFIQEWQGGLTLTLSQPLLRGFGKKSNMARIWAARNSRAISEEQLRNQVMMALSESIKAYWDLVGSIENLRVRFKSLDNAERLLTDTERRLEIGLGSQLDVVQAQAGLATRQSDLISARSAVADASDRLKNLLNVRTGDRLSRVVVVPVDGFGTLEVDVDEEESIQRAIEYRPEVRTAMLAIDNAEIEFERARRDMLPTLDVTGTLTRGGRGPERQDIFDGIRESVDEVWSVGVEGAIPIGNRAARGQHTRARQGLRESELQLLKAQEDLMLNVRIAIRQVNTSRILVESNRQTRSLQEQNLLAERKRLQLGMTTSFRVLQVEEDLTLAEVQLAQARVNFEKSLIDLQLAEGSLLDNLGVDYGPPERAEHIGYFKSVIPFWGGF
mgnify:CR=1 FL=1